MRTIRLTYPHTLLLDELPETAAAIGFFDGIHKGHQKVINTAVSKAKDQNMESAVITFHPHPSVVLKKDVQHVQYITPLQEKQKILQRLGVDRLYIIAFDKELSSLEPQAFIDHFIIHLNIKHLVSGFDFSYGFKGKGNVQTIREHSKGLFDYTMIDEVQSGDQKISSTRIRELLQSGEIGKANALLGRPLIVRGIVKEGEKRGREIGYPTANLEVSTDALLPKIGVYAVKVLFKNEVYEGMASLGYNPTFTADRDEPIIEVNIFDYNNDLYGEELVLEWHQYIRDEIKFDSASKLVKQIEEDEERIRDYFFPACNGQ
ncbi:bifunctional riboflavin kinase/FAD synthetase [Lentibacillus sp. CBA3610]|uniref:bifunctional riboflavin kinase/FAD synthetase n=1 Tax=Lentibacillus sp. CBA3610 TaxID=2518176 RepID=UPI001595F653|nr:bifunctional riboflavin kinase/FAD synthetase [Lentibacillus sp. CBA3610]QKY69067.1 bifunctional riboflavin kinase/FAD synthetase [Lentibacillus sp. CBA3610]